uniref:PUM-HD domain-containing protein n=1 Tax=Hordeum vulgare subsp. vulgare TaxID=112509 RepID=A0A8I6Y3E6_HORVV
MDPGGPPRRAPFYAGGPAAHGGQAPSLSSPRPPPPPPQQQGYAIQPVPLRQASPPWAWDLGAGALPTGFGPPVQGPIPQFGWQQQHAIQPVRLPQPSELPAGFGSPVPGPIAPLHPQFGWWQQQQGHGIQPVQLPQPSELPVGFGSPVPGPIPPLHPQFGSQQHPYGRWSGGYLSTVDASTAAHGRREYPYHSPPGPTVWGPTSNTSQYLDAMVAQQMSAAPSGAQQQQQIGPRMVLHGFKFYAHVIMGNRQGHAVFEALLLSVQAVVGNRQYEELKIIVEAAVKPKLVSRRSNNGLNSLKLLITAVASHPGLSTRLVNCILRDQVMDGLVGDEVTARCFIEMDYEVTKSLIRHAMATIDRKLDSRSGSACLAICFRYATGDELPVFQDTIVQHAVAIARGQYSSTCLVPHLLELGSTEFRRRLLSRLMEHVVDLSGDTYGRFALRSCFMREENELQPVVLEACAELTPGDLQKLVMQFLPLHGVLQRGNTDFPATARALALKIQALPLQDSDMRWEQDELKLLMSVVTSVLADKQLAKLEDD